MINRIYAKKLNIIILSSALIFNLSSCGKKEEETSTQSTTKITTEAISESTVEEVIVSGHNAETEEPVTESTSTDSPERLPDVIEPMNDHSAFDPMITNASIIEPEHYNRDDLLFYLKIYLHDIGIAYENCSEIHINEKVSNKSYTATLIIGEQSEDVIIARTRGKYYVSAYFDPGPGETSGNITEDENTEEE